jgi:hypothetical protein
MVASDRTFLCVNLSINLDSVSGMFVPCEQQLAVSDDNKSKGKFVWREIMENC